MMTAYSKSSGQRMSETCSGAPKNGIHYGLWCQPSNCICSSCRKDVYKTCPGCGAQLLKRCTNLCSCGTWYSLCFPPPNDGRGVVTSFVVPPYLIDRLDTYEDVI